MNYRVSYTSLFEKEAKRLAKKYASLRSEIISLVDSLKKNPDLGTPLGKGLNKIRVPIESKGKGKSGGARVITLVLLNAETVYLASI